MCPIYNQLGNTNYLISRFGTVRTKDGFKLLKPQLHYKGYLRVGLTIKGKRKNFSIHRLVASIYVKNSNKNKYNIVNHLDGNKLNNYCTNFEWTDISGNTKHAVEMGFINMEYVRSFRK